LDARPWARATLMRFRCPPRRAEPPPAVCRGTLHERIALQSLFAAQGCLGGVYVALGSPHLRAGLLASLTSCKCTQSPLIDESTAPVIVPSYPTQTETKRGDGARQAEDGHVRATVLLHAAMLHVCHLPVCILPGSPCATG